MPTGFAPLGATPLPQPQRVIGLDIDGTLCFTPRGTDYDNPQSLLSACRPRYNVLAHVRAAAAAGHNLVAITARPTTSAPATAVQLQAWLGPQHARLLAVEHRRRLVFDMSDYVPDKQASIRRHNCAVYLGDRVKDRTAALRAGARFLWDHQAHLLPRQPLSTLTPPEARLAR